MQTILLATGNEKKGKELQELCAGRFRVKTLRDLGLRPVLLTGDNEVTARAVGAVLGIDEVMDRATNAGNSGKMKQSQVEGASMKLLFDDIFAIDLGGNALGGRIASHSEGEVSEPHKNPNGLQNLGDGQKFGVRGFSLNFDCQ
jgi:hypothetical protein